MLNNILLYASWLIATNFLIYGKSYFLRVISIIISIMAKKTDHQLFFSGKEIMLCPLKTVKIYKHRSKKVIKLFPFLRSFKLSWTCKISFHDINLRQLETVEKRSCRNCRRTKEQARSNSISYFFLAWDRRQYPSINA